jgi:hypothetical protein
VNPENPVKPTSRKAGGKRDKKPRNSLSCFARKVLKPMQRSLNEKNILAQRRKSAKKSLRNAVALCAFAREILRGRATFRAKLVYLAQDLFD